MITGPGKRRDVPPPARLSGLHHPEDEEPPLRWRRRVTKLCGLRERSGSDKPPPLMGNWTGLTEIRESVLWEYSRTCSPFNLQHTTFTIGTFFLKRRFVCTNRCPVWWRRYDKHHLRVKLCKCSRVCRGLRRWQIAIQGGLGDKRWTFSAGQWAANDSPVRPLMPLLRLWSSADT